MTPSQLEVFREASQDAVARLQEYERRMREEDLPDVARVFAFLSEPENLRGIGLNSRKLCAKVGLPVRKTLDHIYRVLGMSLSEILKEVLLDLGLKLRFSGLPVLEIPKALGVSYTKFRTYCNSKLGSPPRDVSSDSVATEIPPPLEDPWKRFFQAELTAEEADAVGRLIRRSYPEMLRPVREIELWLEPQLDPQETGCDGASLLVVDAEKSARRFAAERVWPLLEGQSRDVQEAVLSRFAFTSSALFDFLHEKAREEGRRDRQMGIRLAELAVLSLESSRKHLGERFYELLLSGWAWVGNANALAFRFPAAEAAFERCERLLEEHPRIAKSLAAAEAYELKGKFRMLGSKHAEADDLLNQGLTISRDCASTDREARLLITIAANRSYAGFSKEAIPLFKRAVEVLDGSRHLELSFSARINLANVLCRSGRHKEARKHLDRLTIAPASPANLFLMKWVEGNVSSGLRDFSQAESKYLEAREGFHGLADQISCACIDLDYAILLARRDDERAVEVASRVYPTLERYHLLPQTMECLAILGQCLEEAGIKAIVLEQLLERLLQDPLLRLSMKKEPGSDT